MAPTEFPRNNIELQSDVVAALQQSGRLSTSLGVSAHEGVVTLSGSVRNAAERAAAKETARQVPGVTDVHDELAIRSWSRRRS